MTAHGAALEVEQLRLALRLRSQGEKLESGIHVSQALSVAKHDLAGTGKAKYAIGMELRKGT